MRPLLQHLDSPDDRRQGRSAVSRRYIEFPSLAQSRRPLPAADEDFVIGERPGQ